MDAGEVDRLWWRGELRAAYQLSRGLVQVPTGDPFRGGTGSLEDAARWHAHGTRAWHLARFDEAGRLLDAAFQVRRSQLGDGHPHTLATLGRLAAHAHYTERRKLATERFEQVIEQWIGLEGRNSIAVAIAKRNYGCFLRDKGDRATAERFLDDATRVFKKRVHDDDPEYLALRKACALLSIYDGNHTTAVWIVEDAIRRTRLDHHHPFVAAAYLTIARGLQRLGELKSAGNLLRDVVASFERGYGDHPLLAIALSVVADLHIERGETEPAIAVTRRWFAMYSAFYSITSFTFAVQACHRFTCVGLMAEAEHIAEQIAVAAPERAHECLRRLASVYLQRRDPAGLAWLERAADLAPPTHKANYLENLASWRSSLARSTVRT
jgi:hypothetical protein